MRTFGTILALLLIFFGLVVAGLVFVRIWQDNGLVRLDINTASVSTPTATVPVSAAVRAAEAANMAASAAANTGANGRGGGCGGRGGAAGSVAPVVVGIESGGMSLAGGAPDAAVPTAPADVAPTSEPLPPVDPCPPTPAEGFAAESAVVAVGTLRVYSQADVTSPALRDLTAGQGLWIIAGEDGRTAISRCEVIWQRVRTADGLVGWVIKDAVDVVPPVQATAQPAIQATIVATATVIAPCVGGCPTPCCQACPTPCNQPCRDAVLPALWDTAVHVTMRSVYTVMFEQKRVHVRAALGPTVIFAVLFVVLLLAGACGGGEQPPATEPPPAITAEAGGMALGGAATEAPAAGEAQGTAGMTAEGTAGVKREAETARRTQWGRRRRCWRPAR